MSTQISQEQIIHNLQVNNFLVHFKLTLHMRIFGDFPLAMIAEERQSASSRLITGSNSLHSAPRQQLKGLTFPLKHRSHNPNVIGHKQTMGTGSVPRITMLQSEDRGPAPGFSSA